MMQTAEIGTKTHWAIDPAHSEIGFKVKHLVFSNVNGNFEEFDAHIHTTGDDFSTAEVDLWINPASVNTRNEQRNTHLKSADFFDVAQFQEIRFTTTKVVGTGEGHYQMSGELTIKGISKPVTLAVELGGLVKDPYGAEKALFTISGKINRKDWGLNYNAVLEAGGVLIGEEVLINCEIQLIKQV
jgi:polyisoprenoid-binding protein YceI